MGADSTPNVNLTASYADLTRVISFCCRLLSETCLCNSVTGSQLRSYLSPVAAAIPSRLTTRVCVAIKILTHHPLNVNRRPRARAHSHQSATCLRQPDCLLRIKWPLLTAEP